MTVRKLFDIDYEVIPNIFSIYTKKGYINIGKSKGKIKKRIVKNNLLSFREYLQR